MKGLKATNLTFYKILFDEFISSEELIMKGLTNDDSVDRLSNSTLYNLFFNNIC